jgi:NTE family protein
MKRKRVGLVLSGGVVRGLAHVGVLAVLEREGLPIDLVTGASVGALIGAAYCAGLGIPALREFAARISWRHIASPNWPRRGLFSFDKLERWLTETLGDVDFADLKIPFALTATDLETGLPVVLRTGKVARAVRASSSVPFFITPAELDGKFLGDGGVSDNLPVTLIREMGADYVIGVDVFAPYVHRQWGPLGFGFAAIETMVRRAGCGLHAADCLIVPEVAGLSYIDFSQSAKLIALGEKAAAEKIPIIRAVLAASE